MKLYYTVGYTRFVDADTGKEADIDIEQEDCTLVLANNEEMVTRIAKRLCYASAPALTDLNKLRELNDCYHIYIGKGFSRTELEVIIKNLPETLKGKVKLQIKTT